MNHMIQNANSVIARCKRFIQFLTSNSRVQDSIQPIIRATRSTQGAKNKGSDLRFYQQSPGTWLTRTVLSGLEPFRGSERAASRIARSVALAIGISLCLPMGHADGGSIDAIEPKQFIRLSMDKKEASCLIRLYGKESAFNPYAIGNLKGKYHTYGIPQIKNPIIYDKTPIEQIKYGIKYIDHRYDGNACNAWSHWLRKGWH